MDSLNALCRFEIQGSGAAEAENKFPERHKTRPCSRNSNVSRRNTCATHLDSGSVVAERKRSHAVGSFHTSANDKEGRSPKQSAHFRRHSDLCRFVAQPEHTVRL